MRVFCGRRPNSTSRRAPSAVTSKTSKTICQNYFLVNRITILQTIQIIQVLPRKNLIIHLEQVVMVADKEVVLEVNLEMTKVQEALVLEETEMAKVEFV